VERPQSWKGQVDPRNPSAAKPQPNDPAAKEPTDRKETWSASLRSLRSLAAKKIFPEMIDLDVLHRKETGISKQAHVHPSGEFRSRITGRGKTSTKGCLNLNSAIYLNRRKQRKRRVSDLR